MFRGQAGSYFVIPTEVVQHSFINRDEVSLTERELLTTDPSPFRFTSSLLGPCEFLGGSGARLIFRDSAGGYFAVPSQVLGAARVAASGIPTLEALLSAPALPVAFRDALLGPLEFLGPLLVSYHPDPEDTAREPDGLAAGGSPSLRSAGNRSLDLARQAFAEHGWCIVSDTTFDDRLAELVGEGFGQVRSASHEYEIASEDNLAIRIRRYATTGPVLEAVHQDPVVLSTLRAVSGTHVVPTQCAYYFYSGHNYITLHTDASHCPVTVLVRVFGDPPPLMICPELRGCAPQRLLEVVNRTAGHPRDGTPMSFPQNGAIVFEGCEIPHHRPPGALDSGLVGVAQLCYRSVWSRTRTPRRMVTARPLAE